MANSKGLMFLFNEQMWKTTDQKCAPKNMDEANLISFDFDVLFLFLLCLELLYSLLHIFSHVLQQFNGFTCYLCRTIYTNKMLHSKLWWLKFVRCKVQFIARNMGTCRLAKSVAVYDLNAFEMKAFYSLCIHCRTYIYIYLCIALDCLDFHSSRIHFSISSYVIFAFFASFVTFMLVPLFSSISHFAIHFCTNNY